MCLLSFSLELFYNYKAQKQIEEKPKISWRTWLGSCQPDFEFSTVESVHCENRFALQAKTTHFFVQWIRFNECVFLVSAVFYFVTETKADFVFCSTEENRSTHSNFNRSENKNLSENKTYKKKIEEKIMILARCRTIFARLMTGLDVVALWEMFHFRTFLVVLSNISTIFGSFRSYWLIFSSLDDGKERKQPNQWTDRIAICWIFWNVNLNVVDNGKNDITKSIDETSQLWEVSLVDNCGDLIAIYSGEIECICCVLCFVQGNDTPSR